MPQKSRALRRTFTPLAAVIAIVIAGCASTKTSNTDRTAMEQLLISNAVDQSLNRIDFAPLEGQTVFLDATLVDCVDKNYIVASTRARILHAGGKLVDKKEEAEVAVEIRSGGVGTDQTEMYVGIPEMAVPGPLPIAIPEVKLWSRGTQTGTAKLGLVAYDMKSREILGTGGTILARSDDSNSYFLGMGPWQSGSVRREVSRQLGRPQWYPLPNTIAFSTPIEGEPARLKIADAPQAEPQESTEPVAHTDEPAPGGETTGADGDEARITISPASMDGPIPPETPPAGVAPTTETGANP